MVRISAFIFIAPFFSLRNITMNLKIGLSFFLSIIVYNLIERDYIVYSTIYEYFYLIIKEMLVGAIIAYFSQICFLIINYVGQIVDMEIGLSMVNLIDPVNNIQTSITSNLYIYFVTLMMLISRMYIYLLSAIFDSYKVAKIGNFTINSNISMVMINFMTNYFIIGFKIVMPIFASSMIVNIILGILVRIAPQMNMFVIGIQLKIFCGFIILLIMFSMLPTISDYIFSEMQLLLNEVLKSIT